MVKEEGASFGPQAGGRVPLGAVLYDLDGTLVDSAPDVRASLNRVLVPRGWRPITIGETIRFLGNGARVLVARACEAVGGVLPPAPEFDAIFEAFLLDYDQNPVVETRLYPGARELLIDLRDRGVRQAVVTNKPDSHTHHVLAAFDLACSFDAVVGADTTPHHKPHPAPGRYALDRIGGAGPGAVFVGDSAVDAETAVALGIPFVGVSHGYSSVPLSSLGATAVVDRLLELPAAFERIGFVLPG